MEDEIGMPLQGVAADYAEKRTFQPRLLRDVLGCFPTGVAVVTAVAADGALHGVTINSFNSVSLDPPLVLFSISRYLNSLAALGNAEAFAINLLCDDQAHLSSRFAAALTDKWTDIEYRAGFTGAPVLVPALAVLECRPYAQYDGGDHVIFVLRVTHIEADGTRNPLVFFRGCYHTLATAERNQ
jgi:flavin reductase (DIM6/NTAB) family NADH-FMN oxidoreductase RutF